MGEEGGIYMSKQGQLVHRVVSEFLGGKLYRRGAAARLGVKERPLTREF